MTGLSVEEGVIDNLFFINFHRDDDRLFRLYCCQKSSIEEQVEDVEEFTESEDLNDPKEAFEERVEV